MLKLVGDIWGFVPERISALQKSSLMSAVKKRLLGRGIS